MKEFQFTSIYGLLMLFLIRFQVAHTATLVLTNKANYGPGSLRQDIFITHSNFGADIISVNIRISGVMVFQPLWHHTVLTDQIRLWEYILSGLFPKNKLDKLIDVK